MKRVASSRGDSSGSSNGTAKSNDADAHAPLHSSDQRVLEKGFCWVSIDDKTLTSAKSFSEHMNQVVSLNFADGKVKIKPQPV